MKIFNSFLCVYRSKYFRLLSVTIELAKDQDQNLLSEDDDM